MKKILLLIIASAFSQCIIAQPVFREDVKAFIDYDAPLIAFTNALLVDGKGNPPKASQTVIIKNGKIVSIGGPSIKIPVDAKVIDLKGKALLPGWVMLHEHMYYPAISIKPYYAHYKQLPVTFPPLYLAAGATTIRTGGSLEPFSDISLKQQSDKGQIIAPTMEITAPYLEGTGAFASQMFILKTPEESQKFVNYWADAGMTSFKSYMKIDQATLKAAIETAHKRGLKVTGHLCSVTYREAAEMGIDHLEHGFMASTDFAKDKIKDQCPSNNGLADLDVNSEEVKSLIKFLVDKKVSINSTLAVFDLFPPYPEAVESMASNTREEYLKTSARPRSPQFEKALKNTMKMEKMFVDAGGLLTVGTDPTGNGAVLAGFGSQRSIELLVSDGFTPLEAIKISTLNGAIALGKDKEIGSIEVGKEADLIVIDGDPTKDISDIRKIELVFKDGIGFNSKRIFENVKGRVGIH
ncbi:MAG: amidohydrolase family protein [Cyclobacteriaceae bacterium]|nr:amidohydrolase family protein [Cyclobacteriaceae bacterium]